MTQKIVQPFSHTPTENLKSSYQLPSDISPPLNENLSFARPTLNPSLKLFPRYSKLSILNTWIYTVFSDYIAFSPQPKT